MSTDIEEWLGQMMPRWMADSGLHRTIARYPGSAARCVFELGRRFEEERTCAALRAANRATQAGREALEDS